MITPFNKKVSLNGPVRASGEEKVKASGILPFNPNLEAGEIHPYHQLMSLISVSTFVDYFPFPDHSTPAVQLQSCYLGRFLDSYPRYHPALRHKYVPAVQRFQGQGQDTK